MGLPKIMQIPCHVLANQNSLKFKKRAPLKQFFNINLGIGIIKNYFFCSYFRHISLCFYLNFDQERLLDAKLNSASNEYPLDILLTDPATSSSHFFRYFLFLGQRGPSKVYRVDTRWMQNLIPHPTISPDRNLCRNSGLQQINFTHSN